MIDIENYILDCISTAVKTSYSTAFVSTDYLNIPPKFPCVTVVEIDNRTYTDSLDTSLTEHHAEVSYEINVYTNDKSNKKAKAKAIASIVDTTMLGMKFTRDYMGKTPNIDQTVYRITMRYRAVVGAGVTSGTTTTYDMYRN